MQITLKFDLNYTNKLFCLLNSFVCKIFKKAGGALWDLTQRRASR